jgi:hypothetical protein
MRMEGGTLVVVQRQWNDWRTSMVRLADLENVHWAQPEHAPRPLIHADVCPTKLLTRNISDEARPARHLRVCLLKSHMAVGVFEELSRRADRASRSAVQAN